jgi:acetylornithine deacetylase/succinyl-diaminopimelate desuccinylase-like protein
VRGLPQLWREDLDPWRLEQEGERYYGRGTVDNKGQHSIAIGGLAAVLEERGRQGFNSKFIIEMGEEIGSPGLRPFLEQQRELLAADVFIGLDGPRQTFSRPEVKLGGRGAISFDLRINLRDGSHHSGHWGGLLADPGFILAHALASLVSPQGRILVPAWTAEKIPDSVRRVCAQIEFEDIPNLPQTDPDWGEPGLNRAEKIYAWTSVIVLAYQTGTPETPVKAVQGSATARLQIRHTVDLPPERFLPALRRHLDERGFEMVEIVLAGEQAVFDASRTDPDHPWVQFIADSMRRTTSQSTNIVPNSSGSNPSQLFVDVLGTPTIWIPNSYAGCGQHGPNEHGVAGLLRQGLEMMAGIYWDIGERGTPRS